MSDLAFFDMAFLIFLENIRGEISFSYILSLPEEDWPIYINNKRTKDVFRGSNIISNMSFLVFYSLYNQNYCVIF